ncbi:hypothetical protein C8J57DRAFT_1322906 [Mycena rebaudengoi]|nr:hypothetical protein C8J57DRAFT_1322906 [Mycena rebaudengoi]
MSMVQNPPRRQSKRLEKKTAAHNGHGGNSLAAVVQSAHSSTGTASSDQISTNNPPTVNISPDQATSSTPAPDSVRVKRPLNCYFAYLMTVTPEVKRQNPGLGRTEIIQIITNQWKGLRAAERKKFRIIAGQMKLAHDKANPGYKFTHRKKRGGKKGGQVDSKAVAHSGTVSASKHYRNRGEQSIAPPVIILDKSANSSSSPSSGPNSSNQIVNSPMLQPTLHRSDVVTLPFGEQPTVSSIMAPDDFLELTPGFDVNSLLDLANPGCSTSEDDKITTGSSAYASFLEHDKLVSPLDKSCVKLSQICFDSEESLKTLMEKYLELESEL